MTPSRVSSGVPRAPGRFQPKTPPKDPGDSATLEMLGSNPLNSPDGSMDGAQTGGAGFLMGSLAMAAKGIQGLSVGAPGFVPPEILMWLDNAMQQLPQLLNQQSSPLQSPTPNPSAGTPSAGMSVQGPAQGVGGGASLGGLM